MFNSFRGISLRPVVEDDLPFLFRLFADPSRCHLWMCGRRVYDERGFHEAWSSWTIDMIAAKFVVTSADRPIGLVFDYDRKLEDGYTKVTSLLDEGSTGHGGGVIATTLLVGWLFQTLPLRKLYMEVYGYNPVVARMLRKVGFTEEAVLKEVRYRDGAYWDLHVFALARVAWPEVRERLLRQCGAPHPHLPAGPMPVAQESSPPGGRSRANGCLNGTDHGS
jgi:RimJ/RimL family protein N-acetyltransferase